jgi:hypothetical protein
VDFVFSGNEQCTVTARDHDSRVLGDAELDLEGLPENINAGAVCRDEILEIRNQGLKRRPAGLFQVAQGVARLHR